jgi:hypothetical protein
MWMDKGYIVKPLAGWRLYLPQADIDRLNKEGIVLLPDLVPVTTGKAVMEIDEHTLEARPVAVADDSRTDDVTVREYKKRKHPSPAYRLEDLVDLEEVVARTNRVKGNISGKWKRWPDWPDPITRFGNSDIWYWPDIVACLRRHKLPIYRADWDR